MYLLYNNVTGSMSFEVLYIGLGDFFRSKFSFSHVIRLIPLKLHFESDPLFTWSDTDVVMG